MKTVKDIETLLKTEGLTYLGALSPKATDKLFDTIATAIYEAADTAFNDGYSSAARNESPEENFND